MIDPKELERLHAGSLDAKALTDKAQWEARLSLYLCGHVRDILSALCDRGRLDVLEAEAKREPILLHGLVDGRHFPSHPRGLGLIPGNPRTLREAIDAMEAKFSKLKEGEKK